MSLNLPFAVAAPSELGGQALDAAGDSHLAPGAHLRIATNPDIGLPVQPLELARMSLGRGAEWPGVRRDIEWRDADGNLLAEPFALAPGNPVRGYLPRVNRTTCCWLRVEFKGSLGPVFPIFPFGSTLLAPVIRPAPPRAPVSTRFDALAPRSGAVTREAASALRFGALTVRAFATTAMGPAALATRTRAPFEVAATPIEWIELQGSGTVEGVRWLEVGQILAEVRRRLGLPVGDPERIERWRVLSLPVHDSVRYFGAPATALDDAQARAEEGAPLRFGLHDEPGVDDPAVSPAATPEDEAQRLADVTPKLGEYLQKLVDTEHPELLTEAIPLPTAPDDTLTLPVLAAVQQSLADPGVARWAGFATVDREPPGAEDDLVAYAVAGGWRYRDPSERSGRTRNLATVLCAVLGHPGNAPPGPAIENLEDLGFLPLTPPAVRRAIDVRLQSLVLGAGLALARKVAADVIGLNKRAPSGRAIPFWPHVPEEAISSGESIVTDRSAPPDAFIYRAAQHDWFGRWSTWSDRNMPAAQRPGPPVPVIQASYTPPVTLDVIGPLAGTIHVSVPVPPVDSLAPGAHLLDHLGLKIDAAVTNLALSTPSTTELSAAVPGPAIERAGERIVTLVAHWHDQAGQVSLPSQPRKLVLRDPRPAPDVSFPPGLRYTSRPDATGLARFQLTWIAAPGQAFFRVFYSNEERLLEGLESLSNLGGESGARAAAAIAAVEAAPDPATRAAAYEDVADLFGRSLFEQITRSPIAGSGSDTLIDFKHAVSGALQVLSFYRVVSVTSAQVEAPFQAAGLVPVRVPNTLRPQRPVLTLSPGADPQSGAFRGVLTVHVALGNVDATEFRIRRAIGGAGVVNAMPIIATGFLQSTPEGRREAVFMDAGTPLFGALKPWVPYQWRAEVRGTNEVGGGPSAEWGEPSAPVGHTFVPPNPPAPPAIVSLIRTATATTLRFTHPETLSGALARGYTLEVYRQLPGEPARLAGTVAAAARETNGDFVFVDDADTPLETAYRVLARDPLDRSSLATPPVFLTEEDDA